MKFISKLNVVVSFSCIVETVNIRKAEKKLNVDYMLVLSVCAQIIV